MTAATARADTRREGRRRLRAGPRISTGPRTSTRAACITSSRGPATGASAAWRSTSPRSTRSSSWTSPSGRCVAEPGATFAAVVRRTLAVGLLPKVVPELEGITLGGAVAGSSVESMSFRYGGFHDSCLEYEIVTGTGERRVLARGDELLRHAPRLLRHAGDPDPHHVRARRGQAVRRAREPPALGLRVLRRRPGAVLRERRLRLRRRDRPRDDHLVLCCGRFADHAPRTSSYRAEGPYYRSTARAGPRLDDDLRLLLPLRRRLPLAGAHVPAARVAAGATGGRPLVARLGEPDPLEPPARPRALAA